jgi:hypothetical protein
MTYLIIIVLIHKLKINTNMESSKYFHSLKNVKISSYVEIFMFDYSMCVIS